MLINVRSIKFSLKNYEINAFSSKLNMTKNIILLIPGENVPFLLNFFIIKCVIRYMFFRVFIRFTFQYVLDCFWLPFIRNSTIFIDQPWMSSPFPLPQLSESQIRENPDFSEFMHDSMDCSRSDEGEDMDFLLSSSLAQACCIMTLEPAMNRVR